MSNFSSEKTRSYKMFKTQALSIAFLSIFPFLTNVSAKPVNGYIVTNELDTIEGLIKLSRVNLMNRGLVINGIDLETFHYMVSFKAPEQRRYKTYLVEDINGFSFSYKEISYKFQRFTLKSNTFVASDQKHKRFLCLLFEGEITLYRDIVRRQIGSSQQFQTKNYQSSIYYEYYLFNYQQGLTKVVKSKNTDSLHKLLERYGLDSQYINQLSIDVKFKDIQQVLQEYEDWKRAQEPIIHKV